MAKRRNVLVGLGALAMGSGALITQAAFENDTDLQGADFRIIAAPDLVVRRGEGGHETDFSTSNIEPKDVPKAFADSDVNDNLEIKAVRRNASNSQNFESLLEIENQDAESHDIGITYTDLGEDVDEVSNWTEATDGSNLNAGDVADIFKFVAEPGDSSTQISPAGDGSSSPSSRYSLGSGETVQVSLRTKQDGDQVSAISSKTAGDGDDPFSGPEPPESVDLLDNITVGIGTDE